MDLKDAVIIDVRTVEEFEMGNVPRSINIPLDTIPARLEDIKQLKAPLVICCASGIRSQNACGYLRQNGLTELYDGGSWMAVNQHMNN